MKLREAWNEYRSYQKKIRSEKAFKQKFRARVQGKYDAQQAARRSPERFLRKFWDEWTITLSADERLLRLWDASRIHLQGFSGKSLRKRRKKFWKIRSKLLRLSETECSICGAKATARHHVIQLQHGGPNIPENICGLCDACHENIHPWMKERKTANG